MKFRKKPVVVEATQWFKVGDHPNIEKIWAAGDRVCECCGYPSYAHGYCRTMEGTLAVCPGDWIITGIKGEHYACKPDIFAATYELVEESTQRSEA